MKNFAFIVALSISYVVQSQTDSLPVNLAIARITGDWEGSFQMGAHFGGEAYSLPAKCTSTWDGKKWKYSLLYDEGDGVISAGNGEAIASTDGKKIIYNKQEWDVVQVNNTGDSTSVVLEITGKEKRRIVSTRHVILVTSTSFLITEYRKEEDMTEFVFSNKHSFKRKK